MCWHPSWAHLPFVFVILWIFVPVSRGSSLPSLLLFQMIASFVICTRLLAFSRAPKRSSMMTCPTCWMATCLSTKNRGSSVRQTVSTLSLWRPQLLEVSHDIPCFERLLFVLQIWRTSCGFREISFSRLMAHQVHHSRSDFNSTCTLRKSLQANMSHLPSNPLDRCLFGTNNSSFSSSFGASG